MKYSIVTIFPDFFTSPLSSSLLYKAQEKGLISFSFHNPRDYAKDKHKSVDDTPYGGGSGMLMALPCLYDCLKDIENRAPKARFIALSPDGVPFSQGKAEALSKEEEIVLLCGRYEGFDNRIFDLFPIEKISLGDFVINGGEAAALCLIEASARLLPDFMGKEESHQEESFNTSNLLEHPHYTKPQIFEDLEVPDVLIQGNHAFIENFRREKSLEKTLDIRPDLLKDTPLSPKDREYLRAYKTNTKAELGRNLSLALLHHPVIIKDKQASKKAEIGTSSITNLDIHDIARSARTYDTSAFYVISPLEDQANLVRTLTEYWTNGRGARANCDRQNALSIVQHAYNLDEVKEKILKEKGKAPIIIGTSASIPTDKKKRPLVEQIMWKELKKILKNEEILLLFGTSHGISEDLLRQCDAILPPLRGLSKYNHLSVRAAVALCLERIIGEID